MLALHSGEHFRATVTRDRGDGTVDVQFALAMLGSATKSKREVLSLQRARELDAVWLQARTNRCAAIAVAN